jgi:hypothetical protein
VRERHQLQRREREARLLARLAHAGQACSHELVSRLRVLLLDASAWKHPGAAVKDELARALDEQHLEPARHVA